MKRVRVLSMSWAQRAGAAALLCATSASALGAVVCAGTNAQLASALLQAQTAATQIELMSGNYDLTTTIWSTNGVAVADLFSGSSLTGGYGRSCVARTSNPAATVITNTSNFYSQVNVLGNATFNNLTFTIPSGFVIKTDSIANFSTLTVENSMFHGTTINNPLFINWEEPTTTSATLRIANTLFYDNDDNSANNGVGALTIRVLEGAPTIEAVNNTVVDSTGTLGAFYVVNEVPTQIYVYNNIFYGSASIDVFLKDSSAATLDNNDIGTYIVGTPHAMANTLRGDPKLDANFRPIDAPRSPVINYGTASVIDGLPSTDIVGNDRQTGSKPDLGAYESDVNDSASQVVTSTDDSGPGTLRAAIDSINAYTFQKTAVTFNITGACPHKITLQSPLPAVTQSAGILGLSQAGALPNTSTIGDNSAQCIVLDGSAANLSTAFAVPSTVADAMSLEIQGIAFSGFSAVGIELQGGSQHVVDGNRFGGALGSLMLASLGTGVNVDPGVHDVTIGGSSNGARNVFSGLTIDGVFIAQRVGSTEPASNVQVTNNYFGFAYTNGVQSAAPITYNALSISGPNNAVTNNVIGNANGYGILLKTTDAHDNIVSGNHIGIDGSGAAAGNALGIELFDGAHDNNLSFNTIADNPQGGIVIKDTGTVHNKILSTRFYNNNGLAIDLGGDGVTPNDTDSVSNNGPNRLQNFPVLTAAGGTNTDGTVSGTLSSTTGSYTIDLFVSSVCNASGYGEGSIEIGSGTVALSGSSATFTIPVSGPFLPSIRVITATATDSMNNTSEFSKCFNYTSDTIFANDFEL
ncbi:MAG TPA: right-handed parallel beta-helix repeat-containing protein [Rudaea sp.]|nr:right-handed parallel beta-helix repeat-containing protein [Rudaea sp.]